MINTAVIPAAGMGTRLLTASKESPKEMMPIFYKSNDQIIVIPLIERIFHLLYDAGIRNFYFIVGKKKRAIEDHFTLDMEYLNILNQEKDLPYKTMIEDFYHKIETSNIAWINQNSPKGFGAAVLDAANIVGDKPFMVHAGDAFIRGNSDHIKKLIETYDSHKCDILTYLTEIKNPKEYGVAEAEELEGGVFSVKKVEEKPKQPTSNFALMPLYVFNSKLFDSLSKTSPGLRNELQLTDGIQKIITDGGIVKSLFFEHGDDCIDVGTPQNYFRALQISFNDCKNSN